MLVYLGTAGYPIECVKGSIGLLQPSLSFEELFSYNWYRVRSHLLVQKLSECTLQLLVAIFHVLLLPPSIYSLFLCSWLCFSLPPSLFLNFLPTSMLPLTSVNNSEPFSPKYSVGKWGPENGNKKGRKATNDLWASILRKREAVFSRCLYIPNSKLTLDKCYFTES